jgi:hypothetical protein
MGLSACTVLLELAKAVTNTTDNPMLIDMRERSQDQSSACIINTQKGQRKFFRKNELVGSFLSLCDDRSLVHVEVLESDACPLCHAVERVVGKDGLYSCAAKHEFRKIAEHR